MATGKVPRPSDAEQVGTLLNSPGSWALVSELEATRWTERSGRIPTKLRTYGDMLARCIDSVTTSMHAAITEFGENIALDGSHMPAYANGQRHLFDGAGARTVVRSGRLLGASLCRLYRADAGSTATSSTWPSAPQPIYRSPWNVQTVRDSESAYALGVFDAARARGFSVQTCAMDKGYDVATVYDGCEQRKRPPGDPALADGSRPTGFTRSPRARRPAGLRSTVAAPQWSAELGR